VTLAEKVADLERKAKMMHESLCNIARIARYHTQLGESARLEIERVATEAAQEGSL